MLGSVIGRRCSRVEPATGWRAPQRSARREIYTLFEVSIQEQRYLAEATLPSDPLILNFSLVPSSLATSTSYCT